MPSPKTGSVTGSPGVVGDPHAQRLAGDHCLPRPAVHVQELDIRNDDLVASLAGRLRHGGRVARLAAGRRALGQVHLAQVGAGHRSGRAGLPEPAVVQPGGGVAQALHQRHAVGDEHDRHPAAAQLVQVVEAAALELLVAHRDDLVDDQDLRVEVDRDGEAEPDIHPAGVDLDRSVDEVAQPGEVDDAVHRRGDLTPAHAEDRAVEVDIFPAGQLRVEACAQLEHGGDPAACGDGAEGGSVDACDQLEQRRLAGAVVSDQPVRSALGISSDTSRSAQKSSCRLRRRRTVTTSLRLVRRSR